VCVRLAGAFPGDLRSISVFKENEIR